MSRMSRDKGQRIEREMVELHRQFGMKAERMLLSGAQHHQGNGADEAPLVCELKARRNGEGFATLERWLGEADTLFLRRNNAEPLVALPWRARAQLLKRGAP